MAGLNALIAHLLIWFGQCFSIPDYHPTYGVMLLKLRQTFITTPIILLSAKLRMRHGNKPHVNNLRVWGCYVYIHLPDPKKLDNHVVHGHFLGFTKSCLIVCYFDPTTSTVKHASAVRFDEYNTRLYDGDKLSPGALILSGTDPPNLEPYMTVNSINTPLLETHPFTIQLGLPPLPALIGCEFSNDTYHNVPYISQFLPGTPLATSLL
jgi:hypothetical protein